jgi:hypothetical protein
MPLLIGFVWAAIFGYVFHQSPRGTQVRWVYLAIGAIGLIVGAAFTLGSGG